MELIQLINLQIRMFLLMLLGFGLKRGGVITESGKRCLTDLVLYVFLPCNIVKSFMVTIDLDVVKNFMMVFMISVAIQLGCMLLSKVLFTKEDKTKGKVLQYATNVSNAGFLGNPVAQEVFGDIGLTYASIYLIPQRIMMWTVGISCFTESPNKKMLIRKILIHPCIIAVEIGLVVLALQISLPQSLQSTLTDLSNCNTAVSLIVIGSILADFNRHEKMEKSVFIYTVWRLILIPLGVYICCRICRFEHFVTGVSVLLAAMPAASTTAILASKYDGDAVYASKLVIVSTTLSLISTPIWSMLLLCG